MANLNHLTLFMMILYTSNGNEITKFTNAVNTFGLELYKQLSKTQENLFCSGYSLTVPLNMLLVGSRGNTAEELKSVMGYKTLGMSQEQIENSIHDLLTEQRKNHTGYEFDLANSIWIQEKYRVLEEFKNKMRNVFYAEEKEVSFGTKKATDDINQWVNTATKGKIPQLFDDVIGATTRTVLINAMYFKGTWLTQFDKKETTDYPFLYRENNRQLQKNIKMMNVFANFSYTNSHELQSEILEIPYDGDDVTMVIVLPLTPDEFNNVEGKLTVSNLNQALNQMSTVPVELRIPKFKSSSTLKMKHTLETLGIKDAFVSGIADLSGIDGTRNLFVSDIFQKAVVEVSEEGTEAAAASAVEIVFRSVDESGRKTISFSADHPFMYLIRHKPTGLIYFMGKFSKP